MPEINVRDISPERRGELAKILVMCGYTVRMTKRRKTEKGPLIQFLEYDDPKDRSG